MWTNLNTSVMNSFTVPQNTNSYIVTGLNDNYTYNASIATMDVCGTITSDPITVNMVVTEEIPTDGLSLTTNSSATDEDDDDSITLIVIIVPVTCTTSVIVVVLIAIALYFLWKKKKSKNLETEVRDNNYAQPLANNSSQEKPNEEYAVHLQGDIVECCGRRAAVLCCCDTHNHHGTFAIATCKGKAVVGDVPRRI